MKNAPKQTTARDAILLTVGFGCLVGYARMASLGFVGYLSNGVVESVDPWYVLRSATSLAVLALLALAGLFRWFRINMPVMLVTTAAAAASTIAFAAIPDGSLGAPIAVIAGASVAVLMYAWMLLLSSRSPKAIVAVTLAGLCLAGAIIMGVPRLDSSLGLVIAVAAAFAAGACALLSDRGLASCVPDGRPTRSETARFPWLTVAMVLACGFLSTVLYGIAEQLTWLYRWTPNYPAFGLAAVAVIAATAILILRRRNWMHLAWIPLFVLLAIALALSCIALRESIQIAVGLMLASVFCAHFLHWMIFPALFSALRVPRAFLAGAILLIANGSLATITGDALGAILPHSMQNLGGVAGLMVLALVALAAVVFLTYRHAFGAVGFFGGTDVVDVRSTAPTEPQSAIVEKASTADAPPAPVATSNPADLLKDRIDALAVEYGLTPRETEVAFLTVQGFSCAYIAEKLVVSNSTVRFHQQNLYRKFDVHSRNELIERTS